MEGVRQREVLRKFEFVFGLAVDGIDARHLDVDQRLVTDETSDRRELVTQVGKVLDDVAEDQDVRLVDAAQRSDPALAHVDAQPAAHLHELGGVLAAGERGGDAIRPGRLANSRSTLPAPAPISATCNWPLGRYGRRNR